MLLRFGNPEMGKTYRQARNQGAHGGEAPQEKCSPPLEKFVGRSSKLLDTVKKIGAPLRKLFAHPGIPSGLRACLSIKSKINLKTIWTITRLKNSCFVKHNRLQPTASKYADWTKMNGVRRNRSHLKNLHSQARKQLGTLGGAKNFLRGAQIFKLCPIVLNYLQHIFPEERIFFRGLFPPSYGPDHSALHTSLIYQTFNCVSAASNYGEPHIVKQPECYW